jgi:Peptidase family C54
VCAQAAELPRDTASFHCATPRLMPLASIDPSLAIGLFVGDAAELEDLITRLGNLEAAAGGAPLVTLTHVQPVAPPSLCAECDGGSQPGAGTVTTAGAAQHMQQQVDDTSEMAEEWELL